jgi:uncharacterized protein (TIGR00255 family)
MSSRPADTPPEPAAPAIASMTGFARAAGAAPPFAWSWELRSVNGKALDLRVRLPAGFEALEALVRAEAAARFRRGSVSVALQLSRSEAVSGLRLNRALLQEVLAVARELEWLGAAPPRLDALLAVRGVIEGDEQAEDAAREAAEAALQRSLGEALDRLAAARREEGARLLAVLSGHLTRIAALTAAARGTAAARPEAIRQRLQAQLRTLLDAAPALPEERLAQEAALLAAKADVREELDRLEAHVAQARDLLAEGGAVGRRLEFLCQEFNREANTLCSKSTDLELTRLGLELKAAIDQLREQVQNIE